MFPKKKRRKEPDEFEEFGRRMFQAVNRILFDMPDFEELLRNSEPLAVGFTIRFNRRVLPGVRAKKYRKRNHAGYSKSHLEPLCEARYCKDAVWIVASLPGVKEENIKLDIEHNLVRIFTNGKGTNYYKEIPLKEPVIPSSAKKSFNNGVLELIIKKSGNKAK